MKSFKTLIVALLTIAVVTGTIAGDVKITDISRTAKLTKLNIGIFRSKPYKVSKIPEILKNLPCIILPRGTGNKPGLQFSFTIDKPATIYLFVHKRGKFAPAGWDKTELTANWLVGKSVYSDAIFKKDFPAGKVVIPEHKGTSAGKPPYGVAHLAVVKEK
ncbi:MAG: hypothetical protein L3J71_02280 [Victivallaceae bacterium]|nr:hypothetical protein [Victivallaceae bacterium]